MSRSAGWLAQQHTNIVDARLAYVHCVKHDNRDYTKLTKSTKCVQYTVKYIWCCVGINLLVHLGRRYHFEVLASFYLVYLV